MSSHKKINISKNGPYLVSGSVPLAFQTIGVNKGGESSEWIEGDSLPASAQYALCRCGQSKTKPFCDGTHAKIGFDGTETASREPIMEQAQLLDGSTMQLADAEALCAFARFCDPHGQVWNQVKSTDDSKERAQFIRQVGNCPSGRLIAVDKEKPGRRLSQDCRSQSESSRIRRRSVAARCGCAEASHSLAPMVKLTKFVIA